MASKLIVSGAIPSDGLTIKKLIGELLIIGSVGGGSNWLVMTMFNTRFTICMASTRVSSTRMSVGKLNHRERQNTAKC